MIIYYRNEWQKMRAERIERERKEVEKLLTIKTDKGEEK